MSAQNGFEFIGYDHIRLSMPYGNEAKAREFYGDKLGFQEVQKRHINRFPTNEGCWFQLGEPRLVGAQLFHIMATNDFQPIKDAHPCFEVRNINGLRQRLKAKGVDYKDEEPQTEGADFLYVTDPFGNMLEFAEWSAPSKLIHW